MILNDVLIRAALERGRIVIDPEPGDDRIGAVSVDCTLADRFLLFDGGSRTVLDPARAGDVGAAMREVVVADGDPFVIQPGQFVLASTVERLVLPDDLIARIEGRSSIARLGIAVHSTAAVFEPGWRGTATMELSNLGGLPVALWPGMRICAFMFEQVAGPVSVPYHAKAAAKYRDQHGPVASRLSATDCAAPRTAAID